MIAVVSGILIYDHRILLTQRRPNQDFPLTWECPGGKVQGDESYHEALRRELHEELGVIVGCLPEQSLFCGEFSSVVCPPKNFLLLFYEVQMWLNDPRPREGQGIGWFTAEEMQALQLTPGNVAAMKAILRVMGGSNG